MANDRENRAFTDPYVQCSLTEKQHEVWKNNTQQKLNPERYRSETNKAKDFSRKQAHECSRHSKYETKRDFQLQINYQQ